MAYIISRQETTISPWIRLVRKEVQFAPNQQSQIYHCLAVPDYVCILAQTTTGLIPIVRQYRPAVEAYTWELPAGLVDAGEETSQTCRRELKEETGLNAESVTYLGHYFADTGRLENNVHVFYVKASEPDPDFVPEPGMSVQHVSLGTLNDLIKKGKFQLQLHIAAILLFQLYLVDQKTISSIP